MKKLSLALLFFIINILSAQNLDSLYQRYLEIKLTDYNVKELRTTALTDTLKCAFNILNDVRINYEKFTPQQKEILKQYLTRPPSDTSIVSPSGKFRIHFKKSGADKPAYDVNELAKAADSTYKYEINILGYPPPPSDGVEGGDDKYDIYISNLGGGLYGYTELETQINQDTYTSFIMMDNDFSNHYTQGINGARVTAAHEFHHAIQIGNYIYRTSDSFYHELTSTSMEEFVFDSINDYYAYIRSYTDKSNRALPSFNGYNLAVWNIFLKDRFGVNIIKRTWELMKQKRAMNSIADAIGENGSTFKDEFNLFGQWLFFTGSRTVPNKYFEEAANYPIVKPLSIMNFSKPQAFVTINSEPVSLNYLVFTNNVSSKVDTFAAVVSNTDLTNAVSNITKTTNFKYTLSDNQSDGFRKIVDGYFSKIESENNFLLAERNILNNIPLENISTTDINYVFPQPFRYSKNSFIYIPVGKTFETSCELYIYSADMDLMFSGKQRIIFSDKIAAQWNGMSADGQKLATGVYFYVVKTSGKTNKGKLVIFNE